jgi:hypothetical protein
MKPKYTKGQKVRIVSVKGKDGKVKYARNEKYVGAKGVVLDSFRLGQLHTLFYRNHLYENDYIYMVRLVNSNTVLRVVEEELGLCNYMELHF